MKAFQENISEYRNEIKGIAILWIVFFHAQLGLGGVAGSIWKTGYGGVDLFLLLSGFGLCCSLQKSSDLYPYLKRRFKRMAMPYGIFLILWLAVMLPLGGYGPGRMLAVVLGNALMVGLPAGIQPVISWYVFMIPLTAMLAPVIYSLLRNSRYPLRMECGILIALLAASCCFWNHDLLIAMSRLPIFALGMMLAMPMKEGHGIRFKGILLVAAGLLLGAAMLLLFFRKKPEWLNALGMYWYPMLLLAPSLTYLLCEAFRKLKKFERVFAPLRFLGEASFEIFLFDAWAEYLGKKVIHLSSPALWIAISAAAVVLGILLHLLVKHCSKKAEKCSRIS